jgi:hypothetical protein
MCVFSGAYMRAIAQVEDPKPRPTLVAANSNAAEEPARWVFPTLVALAALPRLVLLFLNENLYGDAVSRTELAIRWAEHPHWISSFGDGARQFGPLHLYLIGIGYAVIGHKLLVGRLVSLVFGVATVWPLWGLTRRLFGWRAAAVAVAGLSVWGMHLQMSTTAGSEALGLFLVLAMLSLFARGLEENRFAPIAYAALVLNLACATRYDCWAFIPLFVVLLFLQDKDKVAATTRAIFFGLMALPFPLVWMQGNERAFGDPFMPIHFIEDFHKGWVADGVARWSEWGYRAQNLFFWPGAALLTLTPIVAVLGFIGMRVAWKRFPEHRWLLWACLAPTALFTFKSAVLLNFVPLARFAVSQIALVLPFVYLGYAAISERKPGLARAVAIGGAALAVALPAWMGQYTFRVDGGGLRESVRPVSPTSTNPRPVRQVSEYLRNEVTAKGGSAIIDQGQDYMDLQIAFFSDLPELKMARLRWDTFEKRVAENHPATIVRVDHGLLEQRADVTLAPGGLTFQGRAYRELPGFPAPYHVYRAEN